MKKMTCKQLGGPESCNEEFKAETWEDMKKQSMQHGNEMFKKGDEKHIGAMKEMKEKMKSLEDMKEWMEKKRKEFGELPEEE